VKLQCQRTEDVCQYTHTHPHTHHTHTHTHTHHTHHTHTTHTIHTPHTPYTHHTHTPHTPYTHHTHHTHTHTHTHTHHTTAGLRIYCPKFISYSVLEFFWWQDLIAPRPTLCLSSPFHSLVEKAIFQSRLFLFLLGPGKSTSVSSPSNWLLPSLPNQTIGENPSTIMFKTSFYTASR